MDTLAPLFAHPGLPRVLRLFLFHPDSQLSHEAFLRTKLAPAALASILLMLTKNGVIKKQGSGKRVTYRLNSDFPYTTALRELLFHPQTFDRALLLKKLNAAGAARLVVLGGVFVGEGNDAIDLLLVSDRLNDRALASALAGIEAEMGTDIRYAAMNTKEFQYRMSMYDKLLRQILESRHEKLTNKLGI